MKIVIFLSFLVGSLLKYLNAHKKGTQSIKKKLPYLEFLKKIYYYWSKVYCMISKILRGIGVFLKKVFVLLENIIKIICYAAVYMISKVKEIVYSFLKKMYACLRKNKYFDIFCIGVEIFSGEGNMRFYQLESMRKKCQSDGDFKYYVIEKETEREVCIAEYWKKSEKKIEKYLSEETYLAQLKNATIFGATNIVISNDCYLNDMLWEDDENRIDLRDGVLKKVIDTYVLVEDQYEAKECEYAISMVGGASYNYYHLLIEIFPKMVIADRFEEYRNVPVLVDDIVFKIPQFKCAFELVNKYRHPVIVVKNHEKWNVKNLIYVSGHSWMPINLYDRDMLYTSDFRIAKEYLYSLRERLLEHIDIQENQRTKRYFISRKNTKTVRLKNEETVRNIFRKNGYEILYPEELTVEEQIQCFYSAKSLVAASGAALTNIIFCQPGTQIVCLIPKEFQFHMYSTIAHLFGLESVFLDCEIVERTPWTATDGFILDEDYLDDFMKNYITEGERNV